MKSVLMLGVLLATSSAGWSCTEKGAFGVEFGQPVPSTAAAEPYDYGLGKDERGCFLAPVPAPYRKFDKYGYCANRRDKVVFAVDAVQTFSDPSKAASAVSAEIQKVRKEWEKKYGLTFKSYGTLGLVWSAETPTLQAVIAAQGSELHLKCVNRTLEAKSIPAVAPSP